jgi:hypothetical protein
MLSVALLAGTLAGISTSVVQAQTAGGYGPLQISWEVRNRFRLFREERDFMLHVESGRGRSVLATSRRWQSRATAAAGRATPLTGSVSISPAASASLAPAIMSRKAI